MSSESFRSGSRVAPVLPRSLFTTLLGKTSKYSILFFFTWERYIKLRKYCEICSLKNQFSSNSTIDVWNLLHEGTGGRPRQELRWRGSSSFQTGTRPERCFPPLRNAGQANGSWSQPPGNGIKKKKKNTEVKDVDEWREEVANEKGGAERDSVSSVSTLRTSQLNLACRLVWMTRPIPSSTTKSTPFEIKASASERVILLDNKQTKK